MKQNFHNLADAKAKAKELLNSSESFILIIPGMDPSNPPKVVASLPSRFQRGLRSTFAFLFYKIPWLRPLIFDSLSLSDCIRHEQNN